MNRTESRDEAVTILGQVFPYPSSIFGTLAVLFVCATIATAVCVLLTAKPEQIRAVRSLWSTVQVEPDGTQIIQHDTMRVEFWTPSSKTKDYLRDNDAKQWQATATEDQVTQFGNLLRKDPNIAGYRRTEVWGQGRTELKPGWWWTMTVHTNYSIGKFVSQYTAFWKSQDLIYIEITGNRGHYSPQ